MINPATTAFGMFNPLRSIEANGNRHRASASEVSKVKNGRPDASVHGFVTLYRGELPPSVSESFYPEASIFDTEVLTWWREGVQ
jgi:hypothetical protein